MTHVALFLVKHTSRRGVMQIYRKIVLKPEHHSAHSVTLTASLHHRILPCQKHVGGYPAQAYLLSCGSLNYKIATLGKISRVACVPSYRLSHNASRHDPLRIDVDVRHATYHLRCLTAIGPKGRAHSEPFFPVNSQQMIRWYIDQNVFLMRFWCVGHTPPATLHVHMV